MKVRPSEPLCILQVILEVILCVPWSRLGLIIINDPSWGMVIIGHGTFFSQPSKRCKFVKSHYIIGVLYITVLSLGEQRNPPGLRIGDGSPMGDSRGAAGGNPQSSIYYT